MFLLLIGAFDWHQCNVPNDFCVFLCLRAKSAYHFKLMLNNNCLLSTLYLQRKYVRCLLLPNSILADRKKEIKLISGAYAAGLLYAYFYFIFAFIHFYVCMLCLTRPLGVVFHNVNEMLVFSIMTETKINVLNARIIAAESSYIPIARAAYAIWPRLKVWCCSTESMWSNKSGSSPNF